MVNDGVKWDINLSGRGVGLVRDKPEVLNLAFRYHSFNPSAETDYSSFVQTRWVARDEVFQSREVESGRCLELLATSKTYTSSCSGEKGPEKLTR